MAGPAAQAALALLDGGGAEGSGEAPRPRHTYYQFLDARGQVRFAKRLEDVPEAWRGRAGRVELEAPPPSTPGEARQARAARGGAGAKAGRAAGAPGTGAPPAVVVYGSPTRDDGTKQAIAYFSAHHIPYELKDVDHGPTFAEMQAFADTTRIPVIAVGKSFVKGWSKSRVEKLLKQRR